MLSWNCHSRVVQDRSLVRAKMKSLRVFLLYLLYLTTTLSQDNKIIVFKSGSDGYNTFRIPAIINLPSGDLLAFCEGRLKGSADFGDNNIVMKRSTDNGNTWSSIQTIVDYDSLQAGNPAPVVDLLDPAFPNGRIFLFYNTGNNHENEIRKGNGLREVWYRTSTNYGLTWSDPVNITKMVHRPKQPNINPEYNFEEDWRTIANTPGHAMQFTSGQFKGRIYIAANHSEGEPREKYKDYFAHGYYTDDHGKTFCVSNNVPIPGSNESTAAQLSDGILMLNSRNQSGDIRARIVSLSYDGGVTWDTTYFDYNLPDPVCQGSLLSFEQINGKNIIAFSNPADTVRRNKLTLRISYNEGKSWLNNILIDDDTDNSQTDFTAYSDIVRISDNAIGVLYERNNYSEIVFTKVKID